MVKIEYDPKINDYIEGIEFRSCDWKELFDEFKDQPNVVFIADPPYLYTDRRGYQHPSQDNWDLKASLKVLEVLTTNEYIYYCTTKSGTIDFINYLKDDVKYLDDFEIEDIKRGRINKKCKGNSEFIIYKLDMNEPTDNDSKIVKKVDKSTQKTIQKPTKRRNKKDDFAQFFDSAISVVNKEEEEEDFEFDEEMFDGEEEDFGEEEEFFDEEEDGEEIVEQIYIPDQDVTIIKKVEENNEEKSILVNEENTL